jgi:hypothetical protein
MRHQIDREGPGRPQPPIGAHRGKGPKGYARSDERVHDDVCDRLMEHDWIDARTIEVSCAGGEVTLEGTVPDRTAKRLAEDLAVSVAGVHDVHNRLRIASPDATAARGPSSPGARSPRTQSVKRTSTRSAGAKRKRTT